MYSTQTPIWADMQGFITIDMPRCLSKNVLLCISCIFGRITLAILSDSVSFFFSIILILLVVLSRDTHNNSAATAFSGDEGYSEEFSVITKKFNVCVHFLHLCENSFHKRCTFALNSSCTHNSLILIGLLEGSQTATLLRLTSFLEGYTDGIRKTLTFYLVIFAVNNDTHILALLLVNKTGNCTSAYSGRFFHLKTGVSHISVL